MKREFLILCLILLLLISACGSKNEKDLILETLDEVYDFAQAENIEGIMSHVTEDFADFQGRDKAKVRSMIEAHLLKYRDIKIHVLSTRIEDLEMPNASFQCELLLSAGGAKLFRKVLRYAGDMYRIQGDLVKEDEIWKIRYAQWEYITPKDLLPESLKILQKLFPNVK